MLDKEPRFVRIILSIPNDTREILLTLELGKELLSFTVSGITDELTWIKNEKLSKNFWTCQRFKYAQLDIDKSHNKMINEYDKTMVDLFIDSEGIYSIECLDENMNVINEYFSHGVNSDNSYIVKTSMLNENIISVVVRS